LQHLIQKSLLIANKYLGKINLTFGEGRQKAKGKRQEARENTICVINFV
jgi:hypothetical protein